MPNAAETPTIICPACGAIDPDTQYVDPPYPCPQTGYCQGEGYRCSECGEVSEPEDWEPEIERARRRAPMGIPIPPYVPMVDDSPIELPEVA